MSSMRARISTPAAVFERVLGAFGTGGFTYADLLKHSKLLIEDGAPPTELLEVLRRFELVEPLPEYARAEVVGLLNDAIERTTPQTVELDSAVRQTPASESASPADEEVVIDFDQLNDSGEDFHPQPQEPGHFSPAASASAWGSTSSVLSEFVRPPTVEDPSTAGHVRALEEQIARKNADHEALARSHERARDAESAAVARTTALTAELAAARTTLELQQKKTRDAEKALAERIASAEATSSRTAEALRESKRNQTELRTLRDSLAARDKSLVQSRHSLDEREAQLEALQRDHAEIVSALDGRAKAGVRQEADLQAAFSALESVQSKNRDLDKALADRIAAAEAADSRSEEALRDVERSQTESGTLRDLLEARDAALGQARRSLGERETQLTALQQEHAKLLQTSEARVKTGTRLEADLQAAGARVETISSELKAARAAGAHVAARLKRSEGQLNAALTELSALKAKESSQLESLRTREWRNGFGQNVARELDARVDAATPRQELHRPEESAESANLTTPVETRDRVETQTTLSTRNPVASGVAWNRGAVTRATGAGIAMILLLAGAWFFVHRKPAPPPTPVASAPVLPKPGTIIRDCPTCPAMTVLPVGRFRQGSDLPESGSDSFAKPAHWVAFGRPIAMAANTVTVDEFQEFIAATGIDMQGCDTYDHDWKHQAKNSWKDPGFVQTGTHPVTCVSWNDAKAYASWLSTKAGHGYRLPSASEWEYAARTGAEAVQPWNPDGSDACANANVADASAVHRYPGWNVFACDDGYVNTAPVGSFKTNAWGLNDMLGNVFQWTEDCWSADYADAPTDGSARMDGNCSEHELRGGSWFSTPAYVKASYRNHFAADYRTSSVGIRLVRDIEQ
jgi:formylglycine-generating enzyme